MTDFPESVPPEWDLGEWEAVLNINVGQVCVCRACQNLVMITKGGVGIMKLLCCGAPMERIGVGQSGRAG